MKRPYQTSIVLGFSVLMLGFFSLHAQDISVSGRVTDEQGDALPGVSISVKGITNGTVSDADGRYSLSVKPDAVLVFSFIGYITEEVSVGTRSTIDLKLLPDILTLSEVVVVGYTEQSRERLTSSIASLDTKEFKSVPFSNPTQALQGKLAGVSIPITSGQPGAAPQIIIRGGTKVNVYGTGSPAGGGGNFANNVENTQPLYVVDGVFRQAGLADLNPDDIESLQVLKDAASTAIYGARGANGVVVVKTKSGKFGNGKGNITFRYQTGWESLIREYDYLNAKDYLIFARTNIANTTDLNNKTSFLYNGGFSAGVRTFTAPGQFGTSLYNTAYVNNLVAVEGQGYVDNLLAKGWETVDDPVNPGNTILFKDNKLQNALWNTARLQNYSLGFDGGGDKFAYNLSLGYIDQGGVFLGTDYKRFSGLGNFSFKVTDKFKIDLNTQYQFRSSNFVDNSLLTLTRGARLTPLLRTYNDDGRPAFGENTNTRIRLHEMYYDDRRVTTERYTTRLAGDYEIIKNLHFRPSFSLLADNSLHLFQRDAFPGPVQYPNPREKYNGVVANKQFMTDQLLQYDFTVGSHHNFTTLVGFNYTRNYNYSSNITSSRASNDYIFTIQEPVVRVENGQTQPNYFNIGTTLFETRSASYFGQVSYDFDGKYLFGAALRYDGFSNFAPNKKFAFFPSASAGWNIHRESFWKVAAVNSLKLRTSYGTAGLNDLNLVDTYGLYGDNQYALGVGFLRSNLSNPNLEWEKTTTFDVGVEVGLLNKLNVSVDFYNKLTANRLDNLLLPAESGFESIRYNVGELRNRGIEVAIGGGVLRSGDFSWDVNVTFAYNQQLITKLPSNGRDKNRQGGALVYNPASGQEEFVGGLAEGERPMGLWAFKSEGIFSTKAEAAEWSSRVSDLVAPVVRTKVAGDVRWSDLNNDGRIDGRDMVFIGYRAPDKMGGIQNTFKYKNFTLRVTADYALGHVINDGNLARSMGSGRSYNEGAISTVLSDETWQKEGDVGKKYPRASFGDFDLGQRNHIRIASVVGSGAIGLGDSYGTDIDLYYSKGDFLALREIFLSYELPKAISTKIGAAGLTLNAGVFNVGYLTAYKGRNPETYKGFDEGNYPRPRQFTLGATLRF
jgi:TonB-linked SusC/RagA family outer membrane protein